MRILIYLGPQSNPQGGGSKVGHVIAEHLAQRGHDVTLAVGAYSAPTNALTKSLADSAIVLGTNGLLLSTLRLRRILRQIRPHVALAIGDIANGSLAAASLGCRFQPRIVIGSEHLYRTVTYGDIRTVPGIVLGHVLRKLYRTLDGVVCVSTPLMHRLVSEVGVPDLKCTVIPNPVEQCRREVSNSLRDIRIEDPKLPATILASGRINRQKDFPTLIKAFARLRACREARLIVLGDGPDRGDVVALARRLGVADSVEFPGFVEDPTPYYESADVFALSSVYEGFGLVIAEALAHGLPVVSTDCPAGPAEILRDGEFGRLVPVGDEVALAQGLQAALSEPIDRARLRARVQEYEPAVIARRYEDFFIDTRSRVEAESQNKGWSQGLRQRWRSLPHPRRGRVDN